MEIIDNINAAITNTLGDYGMLMIVGMLGIFLILLTLPVLLKREADPLDKLKTQNRSRPTKAEKHAKLRTDTGKAKLEKYSNFLEPQDAEEYTAVKLKLLQAGYNGKNAVRYYHFAQFSLGILGLVLGGAYAALKTSQGEILSSKDLAVMIVGPAVAGYMLPKYWVTRRQATRNGNITDAFPDSLDLMLVCVEAGQSIDQSIIRVSTELKAGFPDLAGEFEIVSNEMKAGKEKSVVLRDLGERCGVADITSFVTVLIQSQQFGTSISDALRVYAAEMRDKRVMRAEEKANTLPTKMTLATMMLTLPPLLVILIGPSIHNIANNLGGSGL